MVRALLARPSLERAASIWFGVTVLAFTLGSAESASVKHAFGKGKWAALIVLFALAVLLAWRSRPLRWTRLHAAVAVLLGLMAVSATWSVAPSTTVKHTISLALMLGAAAALGFAVTASPQLARRLGASLAFAAVVVSVAGLLVLIVDPSAALLRGAPPQPTRLRGITENPDTMPLLLVLALPFLVLGVLEAGTRRRRIAWSAACAVVFLTLIFTLSRGGWGAAFVGTLMLVPIARGRRRRIAIAAAVVVCWVVFAAVAIVANAHAAPTPGRGAAGDWVHLPSVPDQPALSEELYSKTSGGWSLTGTSGRAGAWQGTIRQAMQRPILGFGFGTEEIVFFDRYYNFQGGTAEDSYIGMLLQLGVAGLALLLAALTAVGLGLGGLLRVDRRLGLTIAAALLAGVILALSESYLYAAGNIAAVPFWVLAFAGASAAVRRADA